MPADAPFSRKRHPLESSGPLTRALLLWLFPLLLQGRRSPLTEEDVWPLPSWVHSDSAAARVQEAWSKREPAAAGQGVSLLAVVRRTFGRHAWGVVAAAVYSTVAYQLPPLFLGELFRRLLAVDDGAEEPPLLESGWTWAVLVFLSAAMVALGPSSAQRTQVALGIEVRNSLLCSIYGALLRLRPERCVQLGRHGLSALCTTLAGVDCDRVYMLCHFGCFVLLDFLLVGACMPMLVQISGPVGLWGCVVLALGALVQKFFMDKVVAARATMQRHTDRRLAFTQELFENIRSVKMCSLAQGLRTRIEAEREMELRAQWSVFMMRSLNGAITYALVPWALLAILVAGTRGEAGSLSAASVFAALAFLNTNRIVFSVLPFELNTVSEGLTSLSRIGRLLASNAACRRESGGGCGSAFPPFPAEAGSGAMPAGLALQQAEYSWKATGALAAEESKAEGPGQHFERLSVAQLDLPAGCLAVVVGPSGGGKSSLCHALAAWMPQVKGARGCFQGKVAFCPQEPWVLSGTVAENVAGPGQARSVAEVWRCLQSARLDADVGNFPGKLETEIGYRGITLSGGQKARLGLARALAMRQEAEAFILDDVLSALDGAAAEWIVEKTILDELRDTTRVVVLNSHYELLLPHADVVVLVENGTTTVYRSAEDFSSSGFAKSLAAHEESKAPSEVRQCPEWILAGLPRGLTAEELAEDADVGKRDAPEEGGALFEPEFRARGPLDPWLYATYIGFGAQSERSGRACPALLLTFLAVAVLLPDAVRLVSEFLLSDSLKAGIDLADQGWLWQFAMFTVATFALALLRPLAFTMLAHRSSRRLHHRLLHRLCEAPVTTFFDVVPPGRLMNLCGKDLDAVDTLIPSAALDFLQDLSILGSTVLVSAAVIPPVLLVLLPAGWLLLRLRRLLMCSARELVRMEACSRSPALAMLAETVAGLPVIRSQGAEAAMYGRFCALANKNSSFFVHSWYLMPWLSLWLDELVACFVLAACCSALLLKSSVSPSLLVVALTNNISLLSKVQITCRLSAEVEKLFTSVERLAHALRCTPQEEEEELGAPQNVPANWPETGSVSFESVSLRYRPGLPLVLADLTFQVKGGESVGLIGASGCGKSTCLRAVLRMAALAGGRVRIDGVDTSRLPLALLRSRIAVVPQEPLVLSGSVRRNLGAGEAEDEERCWAMLGLLGLSKLVRERGLDMELASGAESVLSLGQRQLLNLGRALLHPSRLLCIDEATANVDGATDAALQRAMASDGGRTRLIVAHRLWTLRHCHEVLVLQPGPPTSVHRIRNPGCNGGKVSL